MEESWFGVFSDSKAREKALAIIRKKRTEKKKSISSRLLRRINLKACKACVFRFQGT
jgi:hypothetical protein